MDLLYRTMAVLVAQPALAALPGILFLLMFVMSRRPLVLIAAAGWLIYLPYEFAMKLRILCSGECNIRIDLLALYPVLVVISVTGLVSFVNAMRRLRR